MNELEALETQLMLQKTPLPSCVKYLAYIDGEGATVYIPVARREEVTLLA